MKVLMKLTIAVICFAAITTHAQDEAVIKEAKAKAEAMRKQAHELDKKKQAMEREVKRLRSEASLVQGRPLIASALAKMKTVKPKQPRKLLVYSKTRGYRHQSIPLAVEVFKQLGAKTGAFTVEATEDDKIFTSGRLNEFDGILMLSTTGNEAIPRGKARENFEAFLAQEKGLIGIHAATDCHADWDNYLEAMGGIFDGHPWGAGSMLTLFNEEPNHPVCKMIPQGYNLKDEIYQYKDDKHFTREKLRILVSLDLAGKDMKKGGMKRKDHDYAVSWVRKYDKARVFYSNLGHNDYTFYDTVALQHFLTGIQFALGDIDADMRPSAEAGNPKARPLPANF